MANMPEPIREFLEEVGKDPIAKQALADAIASGAFPKTDDGFSITIKGLNWMEAREAELRRERN